MAKIPVKSALAEGGKAVLRGGARIPGGTKAKPAKLKPGEHWSNPLQEQHPDVNRFFVMNFESATPETMGRALAKDFEVKHRGGLDFSIRKPGEKKWKVVDPNTWSDWIPLWGGDWSDIAGDLFVGVMSGIGGTVGAGAGSAASPAGSLVGAAKGAAIGAAKGEAIRQGIGKLFGGGATLGEMGESVATEAVLGGVSEPIARVAAPLAKGALQKGRRALLGDAAEVGARNVDALKAHRAAAAAAPDPIKVPAYDPETGGFKEMVAGGVPEPDLEVPHVGLLERLTKGGQKISDDITLNDTESIADLAGLDREALAERAASEGVRTTQDVVPGALREASEIEASEKTAAKLAEDTRIAKQQIRQEELELAKAEALSTRAKSKAKRAFWKGEIPRQKQHVQMLKEALKRGEFEVFTGDVYPKMPQAMSPAESIRLAEKVNKGDPDAVVRAAELGVDIPSKSNEALAQDLFEQTASSDQKGALSRQVDEALEGLEPYEEVDVSHILQDKSKSTGLPRGAVRSERLTEVPRVDPAAYRSVQQELEGMTLEEAQDRLVRSGWEGDIPKTKDEVVDALHSRREWDVTKGDDIGAGMPNEKRMWSEDQVTRPHNFSKPSVTEIRRGGTTMSPGGRPNRLAEGLKQARVPEISRAVGGAAMGLGKALQKPKAAAIQTASTLLGDKAGEVLVNRPVMGMTMLGAQAVGASPVAATLAAIVGADYAGRGIHKIGSALYKDGSGRLLLRLASSAPEKVARRMEPAIRALEKRGVKAYRAGVFAVMHDPEVRYWLHAQLPEAR